MRFRTVLLLAGKTATGFEVRAIEDATTTETRARRISKAVEKLSAGSD